MSDTLFEGGAQEAEDRKGGRQGGREGGRKGGREGRREGTGVVHDHSEVVEEVGGQVEGAVPEDELPSDGTEGLEGLERGREGGGEGGREGGKGQEG